MDHPLSLSANYCNSTPVSPSEKPNRKRKKRNETDRVIDTELLEKIQKAKAERKDLFQKDYVNDSFSSNPKTDGIQYGVLNPISVNNVIIESCVDFQKQLQSKAITKIADIQNQAESIEPSIITKDAADNFGKDKRKSLKGKRKSRKCNIKNKTVVETVEMETEVTEPEVTEPEIQAEKRYDTVAEILSRLPKLDAALLEKVKDIEFYIDLVRPEKDRDSNQNESETDDTVTKEMRKYDWGDTDSDDEQEPTAAKLSESSMIGQEVKTGSVRQDPGIRSEVLSVGSISINNPEVPAREVEESEVDVLHVQQISKLNGNVDKDGNFKEWHKTFTVDSHQESVLHILPYTNIDF